LPVDRATRRDLTARLIDDPSRDSSRYPWVNRRQGILLQPVDRGRDRWQS
jgi:hypothetical protein